MADNGDDLNIRMGGDASGTARASSQAKSAIKSVEGAANDLQRAFATVGRAIDPMWAATKKYNDAQAANAALMKSGAIDATTWANNQVRLREAFDATSARIAAMGPAAQAAKAELNGLIHAFEGVAVAAKATGQAQERAARSAAAAEREAAAAAAERAAAERASSASASALRASIDPAYAAQQRYNQTMQIATQLLMQNKLQQGEWTRIQKNAGEQMQINARNLGRYNTGYVQLGYQAQDVVASYASGINPMVILAQQAGQTASAVAAMGGKFANVAGFIAGPYGAAILGLITVMGLLIMKKKEAKDKTVELETVEKTRKMAVEELTKALENYNKKQTEANRTSDETLRQQYLLTLAARQRLLDLQKETRAQLMLAEAAEKNSVHGGSMTAGTAGGDIANSLAVEDLKSQMKALDDQIAASEKAITEAQLPIFMRKAEAATNGATKAQVDFYATQTRLYEIYRKSNKTREDALALERGLIQSIKDRTAAEEAWSKAEAARKKVAKPIDGQEQLAQYGDPLNSMTVRSGFGHRTAPRKPDGTYGSTNHMGEDLVASVGTAVHAPQVGVVETIGYSPTMGKYVILSHGAGVTTRYLHLSDTSGLQEGQTVNKGETFAKTGNTGGVAPHLHYEVRVNGKAVDPKKGIYPVDQIEAEVSATTKLEQARRGALQDYVADLNYQQQLAGDDHAKVLALQDQKIAAITQEYGAESEEAKRSQRERVIMEQQFQRELTAVRKEGIQSRLQAALQEAQQERDLAEIQKEIKEDQNSFRGSNGLVGERQQLVDRAGILAEEYALQVQHEQRMYQLKMQSIRDQLALEGLTAKEKAKLNGDIEELEAQHNQRMAVMQSTYTRDVNRLNLETASNTLSKWRDMIGGIGQSMNSVFQGLYNRSITWKQGMLQIADDVVFKFADMGFKMLEDWIMRQLGMTTVTAASEATRTGIKATAAATQTGIGAAAATAQVGQQAAVGAAGAYSSTVVIPFIGPVAAPAAAALALATIMGFGALISARGGQAQVPYDGQMTELHKDEMVLPAWAANPLRAQLKGSFGAPSSGSLISSVGVKSADARAATHGNSGSNTFNFQPNHTHGDGADLGQLLRRQGRTMERWFNERVRSGAFKEMRNS